MDKIYHKLLVLSSLPLENCGSQLTRRRVSIDWEASRRVMAVKLIRLPQKSAILRHLVWKTLLLAVLRPRGEFEKFWTRLRVWEKNRSLVNSYFLIKNIFLNPYSQTASVYLLPLISETKIHTYKKSVILCICIFTSLESSLEEEAFWAERKQTFSRITRHSSI